MAIFPELLSCCWRKMIFILWFFELFQLSALLCYVFSSVLAENLFSHWIYWFTGPITLVPGCFSIAENTSLWSIVILTIYHSHKRMIAKFLLFLNYMKSGLTDNCEEQVRCPIQQCPATKLRNTQMALESLLLQQHILQWQWQGWWQCQWQLHGISWNYAPAP